MRLQPFLANNRVNLRLALASVLVSLVLAEIGFRVHLHRLIDASDREHLNFEVVSASYSTYDEALGFRYKPNTSADWCSIQDSLPSLAGTVLFDRRGNPGPDVDDAGSKFRIAVAGDSFGMIQHDGVTWAHLLQDRLRGETGGKIAVYNHSRDGYGILQMIDMASALISEKPDLILIAFITPDLVRTRFWRMERETPGGVDLFTSTTPTLQLDAPNTFARTHLINPLVTRAWAEKLIASKDRNDPLLRSLIDSYLRERSNQAITRFDPFSLRRMYLLEKLAHPAIRAGREVNSVVFFTDFAQDHRYQEAVARLRKSGIPVYLLHLPWRPDFFSGRYILNSFDTKLLRSLKTTTGFPVVELLPSLPMGQLASLMSLSPTNAHPSKRALDYYASRVARALVSDPVLGGKLTPLASDRN